MSIERKPTSIDLSANDERFMHMLGGLVNQLITAISNKELDMAVLGFDFDQNTIESEESVNGHTIEQFYKTSFKTGVSGIVWQFNCIIEYTLHGESVIQMDLASEYGTESLCPGSGTESINLSYSTLEGCSSSVKTKVIDEYAPDSSRTMYNLFTPEIFYFISKEFGLNDDSEEMENEGDLIVDYQNISTKNSDSDFDALVSNLIYLKSLVDNKWVKNFEGVFSNKTLCLNVVELGVEYAAKIAEFSLNRIISFGKNLLIMADSIESAKR